MIKKLLFLFVLVCATLTAQQLNNPQQTLNQVNQNFFIPNKGQWNPEVKYLARIGGMNAWITNSGVVYDYYRIKKNFDVTQTLKMDPQKKRDYENKNTTVEGDVVRMQLVNAESNITGVGNNQKEGYYNYFIGNDKSKWAINVPLYDNVELKGVYKNINVKYYYDNGQLRYDYKAQPGADISQIKFKFDGQQGMSINANGDLVLKTSIGEVTNGKIYAYQMEGSQQKEVPCKFEQRQDGSIGLKAKSYDSKKELIIDPLVYSTFIGGDVDDRGYSITIDASGNAYITGSTRSPNYPITSGAYQTTFGGIAIAFITKLNSIGSALVYSTFVGGSGLDQGNSIAIDRSGNAYITGFTTSSNYPTTNGAYQTTYGGGNYDAFVTELNSTGSALVYSTFIGGGSYDYGYSIAIDASGNAYITGYAGSSDFPTTSGAYQTTKKGLSNAFITKLNSTGTALIYSTFIGGSGNNQFSKGDQGNSIAIDASCNAYITGETWSSNYPTTNGAYQITLGSSYGNAFVTKLNSTGNGLVYSTFLGGSGNSNFNYDNYGNSIAIDASGNAYITGETSSSNYPTTRGAYQTTLGGASDAFVTKLNSTGSDLIYSTFIGGYWQDPGNSITIDADGNAYITGNTQSSNYPTTSGAYLRTFGGDSYEVFVTKLNSAGTALVYSTFIGGGGYSDQGNSIAIDASGNAYITGYTSSTNYPTTSGAFQTTFGGNHNAFVTKLNIPSIMLKLSSPSGGEIWQANTTHNISWLESSAPSNIKIDLTTDGGSNWINLTSVAPGKGSYNFTVPPLNSTQCKIRLSIAGIDTSISPNNFTITTSASPNIVLTSPNGSQSFRIGSSQNITWTATSGISNLNIFLSTDKGATWNIEASNVSASTGSYSWTVPAMPSNNCLIKLVNEADSTVYALSDSNFAIKSIKLLTPKGGGYWKANTLQDITWSSTGVSNINISYSTDNGSSWNTITSSYPASSGTYSWTIPSLFSSSCLVKIGDASDSLITSQDTSIFTIWQPIINSQTPAVGQQTLSFTGTNISLDLFVYTAAAITDTFYVYQAPINASVSGSIAVSNYYWTLSSPGISFSNGDIKIPLTSIPGVTNPDSLVWLKREHSGDPWQNIGGTVSNGYLISNVAFNSFSEFAIGTIVAPAVVQQVSPLNNSLGNIQPVQLKFMSSLGASSYILQFSQDSTFATTIVDTVGLIDTTLTVSGLSNVTKYYWRVNASNIGGTSRWSQVWNFEILITGINNMNTSMPVVYELYQNYPNPFNPSSKIRFALPFNSNVKIEVYNILGEKIKELVNEQKNTGYYEVNFNTTGLASGVYFYMIEAKSLDGKNEFRDTKKMVLLK